MVNKTLKEQKDGWDFLGRRWRWGIKRLDERKKRHRQYKQFGNLFN